MRPKDNQGEDNFKAQLQAERFILGNWIMEKESDFAFLCIAIRSTNTQMEVYFIYFLKDILCLIYM